MYKPTFSDKANLLLAILLIVLGLLFVSCTKSVVTPDTKIKPKITPDRPNKEVFVKQVNRDSVNLGGI